MQLAEQIGRSIEKRTYFCDNVNSLLIVMRHGQAAYTYEEDHGGDIVEGTLKEEGKQRVFASSEEIISVLNGLHIEKVKVVSSPKQRCRESADMLEHYFSQQHINVERSLDPALRDVKVIGPSETLPGSYQRWETDMKPGEHWYASWMRKAKAGMEFYPGEESPEDIEQRVSILLPSYLKSMIPTILVCHEEILGAIASELNLPWTWPTYGEVWYLTHPFSGNSQV